MKDSFLRFLGIAKGAGKILEGYNKCEDGMRNGKVSLIILSEDVSSNTLNKFLNYGNKYNIKVLIKYRKDELGCAIGRREIKVIGITDENMSKKLSSL